MRMKIIVMESTIVCLLTSIRIATMLMSTISRQMITSTKMGWSANCQYPPPSTLIKERKTKKHQTATFRRSRIKYQQTCQKPYDNGRKALKSELIVTFLKNFKI